MTQREVIFFGDVGSKGYRISQELYSRRIEHSFVLSDSFLLSVQRMRDVEGYERIITYLERYEYVLDLWC